MAQKQTMYANSTVPCSCFVIPDGTHPNSAKVAADGTTAKPLGISDNAARQRPDPDFSMTTQPQQIAALAGESMGVHTEGAVGVDLVCGAVPWAIGDLLMSDANGNGITATSGSWYGARAQTVGVVGALCPVDVETGYMR